VDRNVVRKGLLVCGIVASLDYVAADVLSAIGHPAYHSFTALTISELMASGAPTERLVDPIFLLYDALMLAFGIGVWMSSRRRRVRGTAAVLIAYAALGTLGPTLCEMNVRGSGGDVSADIRHIVLTSVMVVLIMATVITASSTQARWFRLYSYSTVLVFIVFGVLTALMAPALGSATPTPWLGFFERINVGAFLVWVVVLAASLWRDHRPVTPHA
jgi:hypothetical protein